MPHAQKVLPQLTFKAIVLGILLSAVLAGANAYLGLFAGMTVSASIPAAVISMGILRLFRNSNILENNIVQTAASAGESIAAGVIFTLPALIIMGYWDVFDYWWIMIIAGLGGLLGVLFTIPLRRSLIVEEQLAFPEGKATAEVLQVGENPGKGLKVLALAALTGAAMKFAETGLRVFASSAQAAGYVKGSVIAYIGTNLSPALLSVGFIVGLNIAVLIFIGGAISWFIAIPVFGHFFLDTQPELAQQFANGMAAEDLAFAIWTSQIRYLGVGAMLVGGIWTLVSMRKSLFRAFRFSPTRATLSDSQSRPHTDIDVPMKWVVPLIVLMIFPIYLVYANIDASIGYVLGVPMAILMVVAGFLFSSVAAYMAGLVGSSNNPISGITIATILFSSLLLLWLLGPENSAGAAAAILIGAVVCCAAAIAGDNLQDLKAGFILGATPWRQQIMQGVGVISAVLVMAPILNLLVQAYGLGTPTDAHPNALQAPQATLMASVATGVFGGGLPWNMVAIGAVLGVVIISLDEWLKARGSQWRSPVLAVAVGIYLPLELSTPILVGGIVAHLAKRWNDKNRSEDSGQENMRRGVLLAAGLITGEALVGIFMAIPIVQSGDPNVLSVMDVPIGSWPGLVLIALIAAAMYRIATPRAAEG